MDTSPEYILRCEKAEEILPHHDIEPEDFLGNSPTRKESVWLPRQDQLQEMLGYNSLEILLDKFIDSIDWLEQTFTVTMEQLWLAFVMKQKYGKVWSGTDWIEV